MWANMGQVHKSIWVVRLVSSDSPWADLSEVFQLMRKISMHMRKHPFLWYKKGYTCFRMEGAWDLHPLEWNQELFPWNHESEEAKHLCSVRCYHMHKWDTGFCSMAADGTQGFVLLYEDAEFASSCPVVSSQLWCFLLVLLVLEGHGLAAGKRKKNTTNQTWRNFSAHKAFMSWKMLVGVLFNSGWGDAGNITPVWIRSNLHTCVFWRHLKVFIQWICFKVFVGPWDSHQLCLVSCPLQLWREWNCRSLCFVDVDFYGKRLQTFVFQHVILWHAYFCLSSVRGQAKFEWNAGW